METQKEALDEVSDTLGKCTGMLLTTSAEINNLVELLRALKERLSDSQSNLKLADDRHLAPILSL